VNFADKSSFYTLFGPGKRSCLWEILGRQKTFLFLNSLVQRFDIRPPEGQDSITVMDHMHVHVALAVFPSTCGPPTDFMRPAKLADLLEIILCVKNQVKDKT